MKVNWPNITEHHHHCREEEGDDGGDDGEYLVHLEGALLGPGQGRGQVVLSGVEAGHHWHQSSQQPYHPTARDEHHRSALGGWGLQWERWWSWQWWWWYPPCIWEADWQLRCICHNWWPSGGGWRLCTWSRPEICAPGTVSHPAAISAVSLTWHSVSSLATTVTSSSSSSKLFRITYPAKWHPDQPMTWRQRQCWQSAGWWGWRSAWSGPISSCRRRSWLSGRISSLNKTLLAIWLNMYYYQGRNRIQSHNFLGAR